MRLLVIEDSDLLRDSLAQGLREAGYAVDSCADGASGLKRASSEEYDVIVLDLMLPKVDGLEILRTIRRGTSGAYVLILTARDAPRDRVAGLDTGADDYLVKPFEFEELLARVRVLMRRKESERDPVWRVGELEINSAARTAIRGGESIPLSAREYALLELLANRAGEVVSRTEIWRQVYGLHSSADSNVVDVFVGLLRKKLERPGLPRLIHTKRGEGYMLGEEEQ